MNPYRIYIAEDDEDDFIFLKEAFAQIGCIAEWQHFTTAAQLLDTLETSEEHPPDLIIVDNELPGGGGSNLVYQIRANSALDQTAMVLYSADLAAPQTAHLLQQGVDLSTKRAVTYAEALSHAKNYCELVERKKGRGTTTTQE